MCLVRVAGQRCEGCRLFAVSRVLGGPHDDICRVLLVYICLAEEQAGLACGGQGRGRQCQSTVPRANGHYSFNYYPISGSELRRSRLPDTPTHPLQHFKPTGTYI